MVGIAGADGNGAGKLNEKPRGGFVDQPNFKLAAICLNEPSPFRFGLVLNR